MDVPHTCCVKPFHEVEDEHAVEEIYKTDVQDVANGRAIFGEQASRGCV